MGSGSSPGLESRLERAFQVTYDVRWEALPPAAGQVRIWIPLAASDRYQTIRRRLIRSSVPYRITRDPQYGNDILFLNLHPPLPQSLGLSIRYEAVVQGENVLLLPPTPDSAGQGDDFRADLQSNRYMVVDEEIQELAQALTGAAQTPAQKAQAIYRYVIERMTYEKETPGWGLGDTSRACAVGTGNCTDFHSLFISLARAAGIPARFKIGLPVPQRAQGEIPGYHCWAEFFLEGIGWVPVDASEAWKDRAKIDYFFGTYDPNRLMVSRGRDIRLVPPSSQGPVNIFFFPFVEVDGELLGKDRIATQFHFRDLTVSETERGQDA